MWAAWLISRGIHRPLLAMPSAAETRPAIAGQCPKYTPSSGRVTLEASGDHRTVRMTVRDTGGAFRRQRHLGCLNDSTGATLSGGVPDNPVTTALQ